MQRHIEIEPIPDDGDEHIHRDNDPDLGFDDVFGGAEETLDAKMLLDPLEEQFDLPAAFIKRADGKGQDLEMIGWKTPKALYRKSMLPTKKNCPGCTSRMMWRSERGRWS